MRCPRCKGGPTMDVSTISDQFNGHDMWCEQCDHEWTTAVIE